MRNYLMAFEVDQRIADHRKDHDCEHKLIDGQVSGYCAGCHHFNTCDQFCTIREDTIKTITGA